MANERSVGHRVYLPEVFINDARECDPAIHPLWERVLEAPQSRRGGGFGRWVNLTTEEARLIRKEAEYRAEYWLTDAYGVERASAHERTAGKAAQRVVEALSAPVPVDRAPRLEDVEPNQKYL